MSRLFSALTAGLLVLGLHCGPALATNNDGESSDGGKTGRDSLETWLADEIKLMLPNNEVERVIELFVTKLGRQQRDQQEEVEEYLRTPPNQIVIDAKIVEVTDVNKLDLSDIPLFGGLVGPEFNGDDMTEENKVGNVYSNGNNVLFVVLQPTALGDPGQLNISRLIVFNDDYSHEVKPLRINLSPTEAETEKSLGSLAPLPSVRSVTTEVTVPDAGTILLGGLKQEDHLDDESQVPFLGDIPVLGGLFRGTAHQSGRSNLLIMITPSVLHQTERD